MDKKELELKKLVLRDLRTYMTYRNNDNYRKCILDMYYLLKDNNIKSEKELLDSNINIGAFSYEEITIFDRLEDESYRTLLSSSFIEINSINSLPDDYGEQLSNPKRFK